ncbi:hypothetical protein MYAM1_002572 [Malassezia yamatoensis]|uniref:Arrestin C-terminal-like domain-containing protein n=1 Tax=Malassezia yamatoensis TaxID=253288 RepID=A0AAJ5YU65_9BASI|nr:hypothetical protein MYAM1_002572 [Malassezia yamatoensis]
MVGPTLQVELSEPVVFLASASSDRDTPTETGEATPPQLRGKVTLSLPKPARIKDIYLTLTGIVRTDWPEGIGQNRIEVAEQVPVLRLKTSIFRSHAGTPIALSREPESINPENTLSGTQSHNGGSILTRLDDIGRQRSSDAHAALAARAPGSAPKRKSFKGFLDGLINPAKPTSGSSHDSADIATNPSNGPTAEWFELRRGTYEYPFSMSLPMDLPATLHADFGHLEYILKATVHRSGTLAPNLVTQREVTLVQMPDSDNTVVTDSIVVSRTCEDMLSYMLVISGTSFPIGTYIPVSLKMVPIGKIKIHRITVALEEQTDYYANERRTMRREVPRKWTMLRLNGDGDKPLLPILAEQDDPLAASPLRPYVEAAAESNAAQADSILVAPLDPNGPWELFMNLRVSMAHQKKVNISCQHPKSNITVQHLLKLTVRVERGDAHPASEQEKQRRIVDIVIGVPITLTHSHTSLEWISLPSYESARDEPPAAHDLLPPVSVVHTPLPPATDFVYARDAHDPPSFPTSSAIHPPSFDAATSPSNRLLDSIATSAE